MQEETNEKTIALYIKTGKLTAQQLQKAMKALLAQMKKQHDRQKIPHGKQTLKQLMKQNAGVSNIEITKDNIKAFESTAKKYGIDFALKKDSTETPPRYLVFFKPMETIGNNMPYVNFIKSQSAQYLINISFFNWTYIICSIVFSLACVLFLVRRKK